MPSPCLLLMLRSTARRLLPGLSVLFVALGALHTSGALAHGTRQLEPGAATASASSSATCGPVQDPEWLRGAVVYGVIPPLIGSQPFKAVTARLDSLQELGVDALWL